MQVHRLNIFLFCPDLAWSDVIMAKNLIKNPNGEGKLSSAGKWGEILRMWQVNKACH